MTSREVLSGAREAGTSVDDPTVPAVGTPAWWAYRAAHSPRFRDYRDRASVRSTPAPLAVGMILLAGSVPFCRPPTVYRVTDIAADGRLRTVVVACQEDYSVVGRVIYWHPQELQSGLRWGDLRAVRAWRAPVVVNLYERLYEQFPARRPKKQEGKDR